VRPSFRLSVRPSVHIEYLGSSQWKDCHEISNLIFRKFIGKNQVLLKSNKNKSTLLEDQCTFMIESRLILLRMKNSSNKFVEKIKKKTFYVQ
jgi:hypothetical protein